MPDRTTAGYVLAGGQSSRMGLDKATLIWKGAPLIEQVAAAVRGAAGSVRVVGREHPAMESVVDRYPGLGPAGGIVTALLDSPAEWTLIAACDMPALRPEWLQELLEAAGGDVTMPRTDDGRVHPLCAVWHRSATRPMREAVEGGVRSVQEAIRRLDCRFVRPPDGSLVANINTPDDWQRWTHAAFEE